MRRALAKSLGAVEERFVISVQTDNAGSSADNQFSLPWIGTYDVDWGDGVVQNGVVDTQTHTYTSAGTYDVKVTATTGRIYFNNGGDKTKLLDVKNWGTCEWISMQSAFYGCNNLSNISATDVINLTNCTSLQQMFRSSSVSQIYTSNWDVSNITSLYQTFAFCSNIQSLDVSSWDVSNVILMESLFRGMTSLTTLDVSSWDVSNLSGLGASRFIFQDSPNINPDISNWVLGNNNLDKMLEDADSFDRSLANWDISNTPNLLNFMQNASGMSTANYDATLISWASQNPTSTNANFGGSQYSYEAAAARQTLIDTYGWTITDGGQVASPEFAISVKTDNVGTSADNQFTLPWIGTYDVDWGDGVVETGVVDTQTHTYDSAGTYDIKVTAATGSIFFNAPRFTDYKLLQIKNWGDCEWTSLESAFAGCANLDFDSSNIDAPNLQNCTSLYKTFNFCTSLGNLNGNNVDLSSWDVSNVTNIGQFFITYNQNVNVNLSGWVINPNITFLRLIDRCNILDVTDWDVSGVTNFSNIFNEARRLREIVGLNTWDVSNGVDFTSIFRRTEYLTSLGDLSSWSFAPNSNLSNMFFASIKENPDQNTKNSILNLDVSNATNMRNMFNYSNITSWLNLSNWDVSGVSDFNGFLNNSTLTTENYDETLISWATQSLQNNINIGFGNSQYTLGGAAEAARNTLINTYGWTITDGGGI